MKSVTPLEVRKRDNEESSEYGVLFSDKSPEEEESQRTSDELTTEDCGTGWLFPEVDLGDLSEDQKMVVMNMLTEEADFFSKDDDDVGRAKGLQINIYISDNRPVQKNYTAIPKPLYPEVKQYVLKVCLIVDV